MKKSVVISILFAFCTSVQAQQLPEKSTGRMTDLELGNFYLHKSNTQKTVAWVLLGGGIILSVAGAISYENTMWDESTTGADVMSLAGTAATVASIPFFISSARNKGRAEILLRHENVPISLHRGKSFSLGLGIPLGR